MGDDLSPEERLQNADDEELVDEYRKTVEHLTICDLEGQIDNQQNKWETALFNEILSRMNSGEHQ